MLQEAVVPLNGLRFSLGSYKGGLELRLGCVCVCVCVCVCLRLVGGD